MLFHTFHPVKIVYLHCSFHITNCICPVNSCFFHLPVPEAALLNVFYHISLVSKQCSCLSSVTDTAGLTGSEMNSGVCVSGNVLSFKSYLAARHKFLSVVFFTQSHTVQFLNHYRCIFHCILYVSK